jgi:Flp pilus assembly protein TadD
VIPVAFLLIAAALLIGREDRDPSPQDERPTRALLPRWARGLAAAVAVLGVVFLLTSAIGQIFIKQSQADARAGDLDGALSAAEHAESVQPYAATPHLQKALILELQGNYEAALSEVALAVTEDFRNWEPRYILSRLYRRTGDIEAAKFTYIDARSLNGDSPIFLNYPNRELPPLE